MNQQPVVWALNAFATQFDVHFKTANAIARQAPGCQIIPVYILSEDLFAEKGYSNFMRPALKSLAHRNMLTILNHDALWDLRKLALFDDPQILIEESSEAEACVQKLLRYAKFHNASGIAIGTHGRSLVTRWFAGSFAESVLNQSLLPVLIAGPHQDDRLLEVDSVVLPTDFQPSQRKGFEELLKVAHERRLMIHLLKIQSESFDAWIQSVAHAWGGGFNGMSSVYDETEAIILEEAVSWVQKAHDQGVRAKVITENFRESTAEGIIEYAKRLDRSSPAIAVLQDHPHSADATHEQTPSGWLTTSVLRDLIRSSPFPLYVTGSA